jgi:hypothetical protein
MKNRRIMKEVVVLMIAIVMILSTATVTASTNTLKTTAATKENTELLPIVSPTIFIENHKEYSGRDPYEGIVWDNDMNYISMLRAQWNNVIPLDIFPADDFFFFEETEVSDVKWVGGYWGTDYLLGDYDWVITFFSDRGDGMAPGLLYAGPFYYPQVICYPSFIEDTGSAVYYEFSVPLPSTIVFPAYYQFWICIYAIGSDVQDPGWGIHDTPINMHEAVFLSTFFGYPDWTDVSVLLGTSYDMCFQLISTLEDETPPTVEITTPEKGVYLNNGKILPRLFGMPTILGDITIEASATDADSGIEKVEFYINGKLMGDDYTYPYTYDWQKDRIRLIHIFVIKVIAYDNVGMTSIDQMIVRKFL